jgi:hypothetical protein
MRSRNGPVSACKFRPLNDHQCIAMSVSLCVYLDLHDRTTRNLLIASRLHVTWDAARTSSPCTLSVHPQPPELSHAITCSLHDNVIEIALMPTDCCAVCRLPAHEALNKRRCRIPHLHRAGCPQGHLCPQTFRHWRSGADCRRLKLRILAGDLKQRPVDRREAADVEDFAAASSSGTRCLRHT